MIAFEVRDFTAEPRPPDLAGHSFRESRPLLPAKRAELDNDEPSILGSIMNSSIVFCPNCVLTLDPIFSARPNNKELWRFHLIERGVKLAQDPYL